MNNNEVIKTLVDTVNNLTKVIEALTEELSKLEYKNVPLADLVKSENRKVKDFDSEDIQKAGMIIDPCTPPSASKRGPDYYTATEENIPEHTSELIEEFAKEEIGRIIEKQSSNPQVMEVPVKPIKAKLEEAKQVDAKPVEVKIKPNPTPRIAHEFPDKLYHKTGTLLTPYTDELIYRPTYVLKANQKPYGVEGEWNVIVTWDGEKYITEHPQEHFNNQILSKELLV